MPHVGAAGTCKAAACTLNARSALHPPCALVLQVVIAVSDDFLMAAGNDSYWMTACEGDFTHDPFNACQVPRELSAPAVSRCLA